MDYVTSAGTRTRGAHLSQGSSADGVPCGAHDDEWEPAVHLLTGYRAAELRGVVLYWRAGRPRRLLAAVYALQLQGDQVLQAAQTGATLVRSSSAESGGSTSTGMSIHHRPYLDSCSRADRSSLIVEGCRALKVLMQSEQRAC